MGTLSCLLPSSSHLFHIRHLQAPRRRRRRACKCRQCSPGLAQCDDHRAARWYATEVASLVVVPDVHYRSPRREESPGLAVAFKCLQYFPRTPNATAYGLFNGAPPASCACIRHSPSLSDYLGIILDLAMLRNCINVFTSSRPNTTAIWLLNGTPLDTRTCTCCLNSTPDVLKYSASTPLALPMHSKCINVPSSLLNATTPG